MIDLPQLTALDWGLVVLVCYSLLQLPLVFYLSRYVDTDGATLDHAVEFRSVEPEKSNPAPENDRQRADGPRSRDARTADPHRPEPSSIACPACGTRNDPAFTFCRGCVARLSGTRPAVDPTPPQ